MRKRRGRTRKVRRRRGVNRLGGTPETTREAGWLACIGLGLPDQPVPPSHDPFWWSVCEVHDPTGEPGAGNPHAGFGERGTGNAAMGAGLRPGAKATEKPPDPKAGAPSPRLYPLPESTRIGARSRSSSQRPKEWVKGWAGPHAGQPMPASVSGAQSPLSRGASSKPRRCAKANPTAL